MDDIAEMVITQLFQAHCCAWSFLWSVLVCSPGGTCTSIKFISSSTCPENWGDVPAARSARQRGHLMQCSTLSYNAVHPLLLLKLPQFLLLSRTLRLASAWINNKKMKPFSVHTLHYQGSRESESGLLYLFDYINSDWIEHVFHDDPQDCLWLFHAAQ